MNLNKLENILESHPKFRLRQVKQALYVDLVDDWEQVTTLPKALRDILVVFCPLAIQGDKHESKDGLTSKAVITLSDGKKIETVLLRHADGRHTACVSSQVGCPLACTFCATGQGGFSRNLTTTEIIEQLIFWNRELAPAGKKITNVVFMGMGEPLLNYSNVMAAIRIINDQDGLQLGARRISISTSGIIPKIKKLASEDLQINLAISLHASNDRLRTQLMPVNKNFPLKQLMNAVDYYIDKTNRQVMFEYLMIDGLNDGEREAAELAELLDNPLYFINLIPYNPTGKYKPSSPAVINKFKNILLRRGRHVSQRYSFGQDIDAACGQLAAGKGQ